MSNKYRGSISAGGNKRGSNVSFGTPVPRIGMRWGVSFVVQTGRSKGVSHSDEQYARLFNNWVIELKR